MTRAVAQTPSDLVLSSTTESQEAIEHAVSENWKEPFIPAAEKKAAEEAELAAAKATLEANETAEEKEEREAAEAEEREAAEAEHAEETDEQKAAREEQERIPGKRGWSKRVNKLTARLTRASEELRQERESRERLEARLAALERGERPPARTEGAPEAVPDLPNKPKRTDFQDEEKYVEKLIQWTKANEDYKDGIEQENERLKEVFAVHAERIEEAREKYDDWDTVAKGALDMKLPPALDLAIREMDNSADVLYHIAKNRPVYESLSKLSPFRAVAEVTRISDKLAGGSRGRTNGNGNGAPRRARPLVSEPITPSGRRSTTQKTSLEDIAEKQGVEGTEEYIRQRRAMRAARRAN